jgi:hypothetical protein
LISPREILEVCGGHVQVLEHDEDGGMITNEAHTDPIWTLAEGGAMRMEENYKMKTAKNRKIIITVLFALISRLSRFM